MEFKCSYKNGKPYDWENIQKIQSLDLLDIGCA